MNDAVSGYDGTTELIDPARRHLFRTAGLGVAGLAAMSGLTIAGLAGTASASSTALSHADVQGLRYILLLKYISATYYLYAATGQGLVAADMTGLGTQGSVTGGGKVPFTTPIIAQYADNIAADEQTHVRYARALLGSANVTAMPDIDMQGAWTQLALQAKLIVAGQTFDPFADEISFMLGAYFFEDLYVSALYPILPALAFLNSSDPLITYCGALLGAESYHAGTIRTLLARIGGGEAADKISALRASLSGAADDGGLLMANGAVNIGPFGPQALVQARTSNSLFHTLLLSTTALRGGFLPNGFYGE